MIYGNGFVFQIGVDEGQKVNHEHLSVWNLSNLSKEDSKLNKAFEILQIVEVKMNGKKNTAHTIPSYTYCPDKWKINVKMEFVVMLGIYLLILAKYISTVLENYCANPHHKANIIWIINWISLHNGSSTRSPLLCTNRFEFTYIFMCKHVQFIQAASMLASFLVCSFYNNECSFARSDVCGWACFWLACEWRKFER